MRILAIDTSGRAASVAVADGRALLARFWLAHGRTHAEELAPCVEAALNGLRLAPRDLEAIAVVTGPGSFTGLRVGVSCAKGMAYALGIPTIAVPAMEALAYGLSAYLEGAEAGVGSGAAAGSGVGAGAGAGAVVAGAGVAAYACPLTDARNRNVYCAVFRSGSGGMEPVLAADARSVDELADKMAALSGEAAASGLTAVFAINGDGAVKYRDELSSRAASGRVVLARELDLLPDAAFAAALAATMAERGEFTPPEALVPVYLRKTQAERLRERSTRVGEAASGASGSVSGEAAGSVSP